VNRVEVDGDVLEQLVRGYHQRNRERCSCGRWSAPARVFIVGKPRRVDACDWSAAHDLHVELAVRDALAGRASL
jgi:hypothetical protein